MTDADIKEQGSLTGTEVELRICADPAYLGVARAAVRKVAEVFGLSEDKGESVTLAVEEALTNVIRHSYGGACDKRIVLQLNRTECGDEKKAAMEVVIRDFGRVVAPESIKGRDLSEVRCGGMGVHIIHSLMDAIEFCPGDDCGMILRMVKYIN